MQDDRYPQGEDTKVCPYCAETIKAAAIVCRYCGRDLAATVTPVVAAAPAPARPAPKLNLTPPPAPKKSQGMPMWIPVLVAVGMLLLSIWYCASVVTNSNSLRASRRAAATPTMTAAQLQQEARAIPYEDLARNTEQYTRNIVQISGEVIQVIEDGEAAQLRVNMNGDYGQTIFVFYPGYSQARVLDGDQVTLYGPVYGRISYDAALGGKITLPAVTAQWLEVKG